MNIKESDNRKVKKIWKKWSLGEKYPLKNTTSRALATQAKKKIDFRYQSDFIFRSPDMKKNPKNKRPFSIVLKTLSFWVEINPSSVQQYLRNKTKGNLVQERGEGKCDSRTTLGLPQAKPLQQGHPRAAP